MRITQKMQNAINEQINAELYSSYLYLAMSSYFEEINLKGMSHWMNIQAQEEIAHTMKFFNYIYDRGGKVTLKAIKAPPNNWSSALEVFEEAYNHECKVSSLIHDLVHMAEKEKDYASSSFLQWYVTEQIEEEASALEIVDKLKEIKNDKAGLFFIDSELSKRPAASANSIEQTQ